MIAAGTLGRQEPPGDVDDYSEVIPQGEFVVNAIQRAMAQATPLTDATVAGTESYMDTLADNDDLLLGIALWGPTSGGCFDEFELCTIPRSNVAPYFDESNDHIGTYVSSVRVGDVLYSTNPGEAFPEVKPRFRIRCATPAPRTSSEWRATCSATTTSAATTPIRSSARVTSSGSTSGRTSLKTTPTSGPGNAAALGFATNPTATVFAAHDASVEDKPGVQFYPDQVESSDPTINFYGSSAESQDGLSPSSGA